MSWRKIERLRRQSCETTVVSTPEQRNGTERVERHGPLLRPSFPQTGELPHSIFLPFRERQRPNDTCRHGGVLSTSVPCPPKLWCTRLRRPWPTLAVPSRPQQGRSGLRCPQPAELRKTTEVPKREPRWPCRHWPPLQDSCRGASHCNVLLLRLLGRPWPRSSQAPAPAS